MDEFIIAILFILLLIIPIGLGLRMNNDWAKLCDSINNDWRDHCIEVNNRWADTCKRLEAENTKLKKELEKCKK